MREILFRGKHHKTKEWIFGYYAEQSTANGAKPMIIKSYYPTNNIESIAVAPKTVGQYTGLTDKNGTKIFEGDICKVADLLYKVIFSYGQWYFDIISTEYICYPYFYSHCGEHCEIIGNIFDNPELVKE